MPYQDGFGADGLLRYKYRGEDPDHRDNRGLRFVREQQLPLGYFYGLIPGRSPPEPSEPTALG